MKTISPPKKLLVLLLGMMLSLHLSAMEKKDPIAIKAEVASFALPAVMLEAWMFEADYLEPESTEVETWMLEPEYLNDCDCPDIEDWMLDLNHLY